MNTKPRAYRYIPRQTPGHAFPAVHPKHKHHHRAHFKPIQR